MNILLSFCAVVLIILGIVGCIVPIIPGVILVYGGLLCSFFCSFSQISTTEVWVYLALSVVVSIVDYILPAYLTKLSGGSKAGQRGAIAGLIAGMLVGSVVGAIIGPFIGAVVGEIINDNSDISKALKVGIGSFLSFLVGSGLKLILCVAMLVVIAQDIFPAFKAWVVALLG